MKEFVLKGLLVAVVCLTAVMQGKPIDKKEENNSLDCAGLSCEEYEEVKALLAQINTLALKETKPASMKATPTPPEDPPIPATMQDLALPATYPGWFEGADILLTAEDARRLLESLEQQQGDSSSRTKRKVHDIGANRQWEMPIRYTLSNDQHNSEEQAAIRRALATWEEETCVRFQQTSEDQDVQPRIMFLNTQLGCASYVGHVMDRQLVSLQGRRCFLAPGTAVHEVGHALGLWHEHQRMGASKHVMTHRELISSSSQASNFVEWTTYYQDYGLPYDFSSVMHYPPNAGSWTGQAVLEAKDPRYQSSMGQRSELAFLDAKAINFHYCNDTCAGNPLPSSCHHGGYQDPNACWRCKCPDGLGGRFCEGVEKARPGEEACGGLIDLWSGETRYIATSNYYTRRPYKSGLRCNWRIQVPANHQIYLEFIDDFQVYASYSGICEHWVEVKTGSFGEAGPRFCGDQRPRDVLVSESREMVVTFRSQLPQASNYAGFRAAVKAVPYATVPPLTNKFHVTEKDNQEKKWTTPKQTTTTTSTTTTTPTTTTTTTTRPTTTTTTRPTTTTTTPTTTTTTRPTTTTTTATTTTRASTTTTRERADGSAKWGDWSEWSSCSGQCHCGGCSSQSRYRVCRGNGCKIESELETRPCNRECTLNDEYYIFIGTTFLRKCLNGQPCCNGYRNVDGICVPM